MMAGFRSARSSAVILSAGVDVSDLSGARSRGEHLPGRRFFRRT